MWQRFTERARRVVFFAQEEATRLGENLVCTEHLLLGLVRENDSVAARILDRLGVTLETIRGEIDRQVVAGSGPVGEDMQLAPRAKRVIDLSYDEARHLNNDYIGTEHLLLGLIREGEGLAGRVLAHLGVELEQARQQVVQIQDENKASIAGVTVDDRPVRRAILFAEEEAGLLGENYVSTEHLLLGLLRENDTVAIHILYRIGVSADRIRSEIERQVARGDGRLGQDMQLTPRAKRVIDLAHDEARQLNNNYLGTEHLLLGLIREGEGLAGRVLNNLGVDLARVRGEVAAVQAGNPNTNDSPFRDYLTKRTQETVPSARPSVGDLGRLASPENRLGVEVAVDAAAVRELTDVFQARDGYGYQELLDLGRVFVAATGELVKYLVAPRDSGTELPPNSSIFVRILEGVHEGRKGWIAADTFAHVGPDETPFPPEESSLTLDSGDSLP